MPTRVEQQERTRRRLLAAAAEIFDERGLLDSTVEQIAERAGFTRGAVYSIFRNKEDLALALIAERIDAIVRLVSEADPEEHDPRAAIALFAVRFRDFFTGPIPTLFHEFRALAIRRPELASRLRELYDPLISALSSVLERTVPALGRRRYAAGLAALANGLSMETLANPDLAADPELFGDLVLAIAAGVDAPPPPARRGAR